MKNKAVITFMDDEVQRLQQILSEKNPAEAFKFLAELDKKITEFIEPH